MMVRMYKPEARKRFNAGEQIFVLPCKVRVGNMYLQPSIFVPSMFVKNEQEPEKTFDRIVNEYEYYNCNAETGYYAAFYREEE